MSAPIQLTNGDETNPVAETLRRYDAEREKRLRPDEGEQYVNPLKDTKFGHFLDDPWVSASISNPGLETFPNGSRVQVLILGAGYGGETFAARLKQAGIDDVCLVDAAGGYGGTWYWNRYPGLMCDVESYIYMPLLEEVGYMPKEKYSSGVELREHAERLADHFDLRTKTIFRVRVKEITWLENDHEWSVHLERAGSSHASHEIRAQYVINSTGPLNLAKLPGIPGLGDFRGDAFHTSRWNYSCTGGTPEDPSLVNLQDKKVAIIGTGATAVQVVPHLGRWAQKLFVIQRTPSAVDVRDNRSTDPKLWEDEIKASGKGWQRRRMANFNAWVAGSEPPPTVDYVQDGWTGMKTFGALVGGRKVTPDKIPEYMAMMQALDLPRQERLRERVAGIVHDKTTAEELKPWYAGWCKRPCFHDEYLATFNLPNVQLVDTNGQGVDRITPTGLTVRGIDYEVDVIIFSTGFYTSGDGDPYTRGDLNIVGRDGVTMGQKWDGPGVATLHGITSHGFPNLFLSGPSQIGVAANFVSQIDQVAMHVAYLISASTKFEKENGGKAVVEPTTEAEEAWAKEIVSRAGVAAVLGGCTPGYLNGEGAAAHPGTLEQQLKGARRAPWGEGINDWIRIIEAWRSDGLLKGLTITS